MTEFLLHVGPHKTGSTYIQLGLDQNFPTLLRKSVFVPTDWRDSEQNPSHTGFVRKLNAPDLPSLERTFAGWASDGYAKVVISSEELSNSSEEDLAAVRQLFGKNRCTVVFYVRRWSDLLASVWNEVVVHGGTTSLPEFLLSALRDPCGSSAINFGLNVNRFLSVFGADSVRLVSYDTVLNRKRDLFQHFAQKFLGVTDLPAPTVAKANASFDRVDAEIVRLLNLLDHLQGLQPSARNAIKFREQAANLDLMSLRGVITQFQRCVELDDRKEPFATILAENSDRLAAQFVGPIPDGAVYPAKVIRLEYIASECVFAPGLMDQLAALRDQLHGTAIETKAGIGKFISLFSKRRTS